jgi:hypothetical protein
VVVVIGARVVVVVVVVVGVWVVVVVVGLTLVVLVLGAVVVGDVPRVGITGVEPVVWKRSSSLPSLVGLVHSGVSEGFQGVVVVLLGPLDVVALVVGAGVVVVDDDLSLGRLVNFLNLLNRKSEPVLLVELL